MLPEAGQPTDSILRESGEVDSGLLGNEILLGSKGSQVGPVDGIGIATDDSSVDPGPVRGEILAGLDVSLYSR